MPLKKTIKSVASLLVTTQKWYIKFLPTNLFNLAKFNNKLKIKNGDQETVIKLNEKPSDVMPSSVEEIKSPGKVPTGFDKYTIHMNGFLILLIAVLIGCGDDNPVNNNTGNNNETLIWSVDSFKISGAGTIEKDTQITITDTSITKLRCTFTSVSDCDTGDVARIYVVWSTKSFAFYYRDFNGSQNITGDYNNSLNWCYSTLHHESSLNKTILVKNLKLFKIN